MRYLESLTVLALVAGGFVWFGSLMRPRQSDFDAIKAYAIAHGLTVDKIDVGGNHGFYWLLGHLRLSNIARLYVINGTTSDGTHREIHVAFDPWDSGVLKVLEERSLSS